MVLKSPGAWKRQGEGIARNVLLLGVRLNSDLGRDKWRAHESTTHQPQSLVGKGWNWNQMSEKQSPRLPRNCQVGPGFGRNYLPGECQVVWREQERGLASEPRHPGGSMFPASRATQAVRALT